jgi:hypothetical protein
LIGKGGSHLKALTAKTLTKIHVPSLNASPLEETNNTNSEDAVDGDMMTVSISGDILGVREAKQVIQDLVKEKVNRAF